MTWRGVVQKSLQADGALGKYNKNRGQPGLMDEQTGSGDTRRIRPDLQVLRFASKQDDLDFLAEIVDRGV